MPSARHILVTGGEGQLGCELAAAHWPDDVVLHFPTRDVFNLADPASISRALADQRFDTVINAGAYTAVDKAETDIVTAFAVNALGPAALAQESARQGAALIQISTDYVFDGAVSRPYTEHDAVSPINAYGASKLAGERAALAGNPRSLVLRTVWVLSPHRRNFLKTILHLAQERPVIRVVCDQLGCPTAASDSASALTTITQHLLNDPQAPTELYHFVNAGETSWAGLAAEVMELSARLGAPNAVIEPILSSAYPTPACRPANSRLSTSNLHRDFGIAPRRWPIAVAEIVEKLHVGIAQ